MIEQTCIRFIIRYYLEACLDDVNHAALNSRVLPAKHARPVTKNPADAAGIDQRDSTGSVLRGILLHLLDIPITVIIE